MDSGPAAAVRSLRPLIGLGHFSPSSLVARERFGKVLFKISDSLPVRLSCFVFSVPSLTSQRPLMNEVSYACACSLVYTDSCRHAARTGMLWAGADSTLSVQTASSLPPKQSRVRYKHMSTAGAAPVLATVCNPV